MIFTVFEDVDAETDDDLSIATTQDSKEDTLTESSDMAEDTTLIKSTEISIVEDMCVKEEIMTGMLSFNIAVAGLKKHVLVCYCSSVSLLILYFVNNS